MLGTLSSIAGEAVTYQVNGGSSYRVPAVFGSSDVEIANTDDLYRLGKTTDFIILKADLPVLPSAGDTITKANGETFKVMSQGGEAQWQYTDGQQLTIRIHTLASNL
jgi:hypothetical protein